MAQLKDLLPQIPKDELAILRDLNSKLDTTISAFRSADTVDKFKTFYSAVK